MQRNHCLWGTLYVCTNGRKPQNTFLKKQFCQEMIKEQESQIAINTNRPSS